ncbi:MAG: ferric acinetobactin ABC transporter permease subunit BauD, partial [Acinetobacter pittii]
MQFGLFFIFIILCICSLLLGAESIQWSNLFSFSHESWLTLTASRIPRLITIVLTGIGLAVCGVILQHIVRNKFVEPETSGGLDAAKLGILVSLTLVPVTSTLSKMIFAIIFCFIASLIYIAIIRRIRFRNTVLVPVIGLMYGSVLSALAEFYAYRFNILQSMQGWLLGDFSKIVQGHYEVIYIIFPIVVLTYLFAHRFTVIGMGEEMASSLGLSYAAIAAIGLILVAIT